MQHTIMLLTKGTEFIGKECHGAIRQGCLVLETSEKKYTSTPIESVQVRVESPTKIDVVTRSGNTYVFQARGPQAAAAAAWWADKVRKACEETRPSWGELLAKEVIRQCRR